MRSAEGKGGIAEKQSWREAGLCFMGAGVGGDPGGGGDCGLGGSNPIAKNCRRIARKLRENCGKLRTSIPPPLGSPHALVGGSQ